VRLRGSHFNADISGRTAMAASRDRPHFAAVAFEQIEIRR
jgi:hypothetical protein